MKNPSEAFMKALNKHMNSLPEGKEDINTVLHEFVEKYNQALDLRGPLTEKTARTSDDFLELAENAPSKAKTIKYLKRACELDDGNVDAELQLIGLTSKTSQEYFRRIETLLAKARKQMEAEGFFAKENIGEFWLMTETRPFMRVYQAYMDELMSDGKMRLAVEAGTDMLRLCHNDNMGIRYAVMNCYAALEDEKAAMALQKRYKEDSSAMFLLPLSLLFYRLGKEEKARQYLEELTEENADTKRFFDLMASDHTLNVERSPYGYRPGTIEEFEECLKLRPETYMECLNYWTWGRQQLKEMRKAAKGKAKAVPRRKK